MRLEYEAYEDNAGTIYVFGGSDEVEWAHVYRAEPTGPGDMTHAEMAGYDWLHLVQGLSDPIEDGWDNLDKAERIDLYREVTEDIPATLIAWSEWDAHFPLGIRLRFCGNAGTDFAVMAGAAARCPECGEIVPAAPDSSPDGFGIPMACGACGCELPPLSDL